MLDFVGEIFSDFVGEIFAELGVCEPEEKIDSFLNRGHVIGDYQMRMHGI
jgi:hypothetical protein